MDRIENDKLIKKTEKKQLTWMPKRVPPVQSRIGWLEVVEI